MKMKVWQKVWLWAAVISMLLAITNIVGFAIYNRLINLSAGIACFICWIVSVRNYENARDERR